MPRRNKYLQFVPNKVADIFKKKSLCKTLLTFVCNILKSRIANWSIEMGVSVVSWPQGSGLLMQTRLDRRQKIWMNGTLEGQCLRSTVGYTKGKSPS